MTSESRPQTPDREPRTEAGRRLHGEWHKSQNTICLAQQKISYGPCPLLDTILAIEAEARATLLRSIRAEVAALRSAMQSEPMERVVNRAAVLSILDCLSTDTEGAAATSDPNP